MRPSRPLPWRSRLALQRRWPSCARGSPPRLGRNVGLGQDFSSLPGPKVAWPIVAIHLHPTVERRFREIKTRPPAGVHPNPRFILSLTFSLCVAPSDYGAWRGAAAQDHRRRLADKSRPAPLFFVSCSHFFFSKPVTERVLSRVFVVARGSWRDGGAAAGPLAGARTRRRLSAPPSSGPRVVPLARVQGGDHTTVSPRARGGSG